MALIIPRDPKLVSALKDFFAPLGLDIDWRISMPNSISDYPHYWIKDFDGAIAFKDNKRGVGLIKSILTLFMF